jgi:PAS domain S-box-containing protein
VLNKGVILVVDDDVDALSLLTTLLSEEGYQVRPADSGKLALASVRTAPPELILLDMKMPDMDGMEVCGQLKSWEETREIPVMFISGSTNRTERVEALRTGAVDFVDKPFDRAELIARVRTHLELSRLRSQLEKQVESRTDALRHTVSLLEREVAERKRTEQALRESEERFRNVADTAPVKIVTSDANQQATFFNREWLTFTGLTMEESLGYGWTASVHPDDLENVVSSISASYAERKECRIEYRVRRVDGEYRTLICRGVPRFEAGSFVGYICSMVDVTELKQNQETLEEYQRQLQELTAGLLTAQEDASRALARELHDRFSQELSAVGTQLYSLQEQVSDNGALSYQLRELGKQVARLAEDIHRTSRELHPGVLEDLGLAPALEDECDAFEQRTGISTLLNTEHAPSSIRKDISLCLYRIAQESLTNIAKHAAGVRVARVILSEDSGEAVLRVEDDGSGFEVQDARKKGGLGLISMEERVRLVGGSVTLRSEGGKGSVVEVRVPLRTSQKACGC